MFYPRLILPALENHLKEPEATILTGMRRTGKTAILRHLFENLSSKNKMFIDFELASNRELWSLLDYEEILNQLVQNHGLNRQEKIYIFFDEIQTVSNLASVMKYLVDHHEVKFVATGSSSFYLKNLFTETMVGRKRIFELFPLTFSEFLIFKEKVKFLPNFPPTANINIANLKQSTWQEKNFCSLYEEYLQFGGFPKVVLAALTQKGETLNEILFSYLDQDVKSLANFRKIKDMEKLIKLLSARIGQKIEINKLSREIGLTRETIEEYLGFLEKTYLIFRLPPFSRSKDREISKATKLYFCDCGLANHFGHVGIGSLLENAVFQNLRVKVEKKHALEEINYYQRKDGAEIDFVLHEQIAVEVKETVDIYDFKRTQKLAAKLGLAETILVSKNHSRDSRAIYACQI